SARDFDRAAGWVLPPDPPAPPSATPGSPRSEEHTSELQSQSNLVCRLLLEKKKRTQLRLFGGGLFGVNEHQNTQQTLPLQARQHLCECSHPLAPIARSYPARSLQPALATSP